MRGVKRKIKKNINFMVAMTMALIAVFIWSSNNLVAAYLSERITPFEFAFFRWFIVCIVLVAFSYKKIIKYLPVLKQEWKFLCALACAGMVFDNLLFYSAGNGTSPVNMGIIYGLMPVFVLVFELLFLRSRTTFGQLLGIIIAFFSVIYVIIDGDVSKLVHLRFNKYDLFVLGACLCFSVYTFLQSRRLREIPRAVFLAAVACFASVILFPIFVFQEVQSYNLNNLIWQDVLVILYVGLCVGLVSHLFWARAIKKIGSLKTGVFNYFSTPFAIILVYVFIGTVPTSTQLIGCIGVIFGCVLVTFMGKHKHPLPKTKKKSKVS